MQKQNDAVNLKLMSKKNRSYEPTYRKEKTEEGNLCNLTACYRFLNIYLIDLLSLEMKHMRICFFDKSCFSRNIYGTLNLLVNKNKLSFLSTTQFVSLQSRLDLTICSLTNQTYRKVRCLFLVYINYR